MSDPTHISSNRTIRTPGAFVTIGGELDTVDRLYRLFNKALLDTGDYRIPSPDDNPWKDYNKQPNQPTVDHLLSEVERLTEALANSTDHQQLQALRRQLGDAANEIRILSEVNVTLKEQRDSAVRALGGPGADDLKITVALHHLLQ